MLLWCLLVALHCCRVVPVAGSLWCLSLSLLGLRVLLLVLLLGHAFLLLVWLLLVVERWLLLLLVQCSIVLFVAGAQVV